MIEILKEFYNSISIIDLIYLILTILSLVKCYRKGFVLSILAMSKWLFAYIITLIIFPKAKPYVKDIIDSEYILDIVLGLLIFVIIIFLVLLISKGISKAIKYTGLGTLRLYIWILFWVCKIIYNSYLPIFSYSHSL